MKKKANELEFICQINRDGSGTTPVSEGYLKQMLENPLMKDDEFEIRCLSLSEKTFIASEFNSFVVRLKPEPEKPVIDYRGCCMACIKWRETQGGQGECKVFEKYTDEGFFCKAFYQK